MSAVFKSTRPARDATLAMSGAIGWLKFQSTRPARATWSGTFDRQREWRFNPRAPRRRRIRRGCAGRGARMFQSTRPARNATPGRPPARQPGFGFNPRAPRGTHSSRLAIARQACSEFQSTRPARARLCFRRPENQYDVSIHAPARDADNTRYHRARAPVQSTRPARGRIAWSILDGCSMKFQSTRPARAATVVISGRQLGNEFQSHAPRAGRDRVRVRP